MLRLFLRERRAWIGLFVVLQLWLNLLFWLDPGFPASILYVNVTNTTIFILFLCWRFYVETKELTRVISSLERKGVKQDLLSARGYRAGNYAELYEEALGTLLTRAENEANRLNVEFSEESDRTLAWIHEVKTPMTAMKLLIENVQDSKQRKKLELEWIRIHLLLDQQLHINRLPFMESDNRMERISLKSLVHKEIKDLQAWCYEKDLGFDLDELDKELVTDQKWLSFIVRQLLSNAVKYSLPGTEIRIWTSVAASGHLCLHVKDEGTGISAADMPRIFRKSFTGTTGRVSSASTGMGLYLAKNAADKLGIRIIAESEVGKGSMFTLQFPMENEYTNIYGR